MQGVVTAPILFAIEEFPQLREVVDRGFKNPADVDIVSVSSLLIPFELVLSLHTARECNVVCTLALNQPHHTLDLLNPLLIYTLLIT